jgi:hypothetical protein
MHSKIHYFFSCSDLVRYEILRPLSHILPNWKLSWSFDDKRYESEDDSFASLLNDTIDELESCVPPARYHDNENALAEHVQKHLNWGIRRQGNIWVSRHGKRLAPDDYIATLQQGGFYDIDERKLIFATAGRIQAALQHRQNHYDDVEESHRRIIAGAMCSILYHRAEL